VIAKKNSTLELYGENNEPVEMKEVSTIAVTEATVALVLSSHTSPNGRVSNNDKTLAKYNPFHTRAHKIGKEALIMEGIKVNVQGSLPPNFYDWVTAYGLDLHPDAKQYASHTSGGHSALRTLVNLMAAAHWTELLTMCLSLTDGFEKVVIVCPGDKYQKSTTIIDSVMRFDCQQWYPIRDDMKDSEKAAARKHQKRFHEDAERTRLLPHFGIMENNNRNQEFLIIHSEYEHVNDHALELCHRRKHITHRSVRPVDNNYDLQYF